MLLLVSVANPSWPTVSGSTSGPTQNHTLSADPAFPAFWSVRLGREILDRDLVSHTNHDLADLTTHASLFTPQARLVGSYYAGLAVGGRLGILSWKPLPPPHQSSLSRPPP